MVRYFPDKLPIGVQPYAPPHVLIYLVTRPSPVDFRAFLIRHAFLLSRFYQWTIRLLFPRPLTRAIPAYQQAAREHLAFRLSPSSANELKWFFRERQRCQSLLPGAADRRFRDAAKTFNAPRFAALYRAWLTDGDTALWTADSVALPDAVERGEGHIECTVLARQYLHLAPLVGIA